mgnify:CR=1 FL=1
MTAKKSSEYWMIGVLYCWAAFVLTATYGIRPSKWLELAAMYAVVWPGLRAWRHGS